MRKRDEDSGERRMPMGFNKGIKLKELPTRELQKTRAWCEAREAEGKDWHRLIESIDFVIESREGLPLGLEETKRRSSTTKKARVQG